MVLQNLIFLLTIFNLCNHKLILKKLVMKENLILGVTIVVSVVAAIVIADKVKTMIG